MKFLKCNFDIFEMADCVMLTSCCGTCLFDSTFRTIQPKSINFFFLHFHRRRLFLHTLSSAAKQAEEKIHPRRKSLFKSRDCMPGHTDIKKRLRKLRSITNLNHLTDTIHDCDTLLTLHLWLCITSYARCNA